MLGIIKSLSLGIGIGAVVVLIAFLSVPLLGYGWHVIHGNFIDYQEWQIPVPKGFFVNGMPEHLSMSRYTLGVPVLNRPFGFIGIVINPSGKPFKFEGDIEDSSRKMIAVGLSDGYTFYSKRTLLTKLNTAYCFEFYKEQTPSSVLVRCAIDGSTLLFTFLGDKRFSADFYTVVAGFEVAK